MGKLFLNMKVPSTQDERGSERTLKAFLSNEVPYLIGNVLLTLMLTVLAPFQNCERTYTDSTCPISEK